MMNDLLGLPLQSLISLLTELMIISKISTSTAFFGSFWYKLLTICFIALIAALNSPISILEYKKFIQILGLSYLYLMASWKAFQAFLFSFFLE